MYRGESGCFLHFPSPSVDLKRISSLLTSMSEASLPIAFFGQLFDAGSSIRNPGIPGNKA
jgi:hypothetical protein